MKFSPKRFRKMAKLKLPVLAAAVLGLGFLLGQSTRKGAVPQAEAATTAVPAHHADADEVILYSQLDNPFIPRKEINRQDQACNDMLRGHAMEPKVLADGTKEFDLTASAFTWQLYNTARMTVWGYNQQVPGPLIRLKVGDKVKFVFKNKLPQETTVHWHGLAVPNSEDGVPDITQKPVPPGGSHTYAFTVTSQMVGTHLYHTHFNDSFQMDMGLHGVLIVDPAKRPARPYDVEAIYEMGAFKIAGVDQENVFTLNGKAFPEAPVLDVPQGARVLLRLVNASAENQHVMHLHGYTFKVVALDGNPVERPYQANTVDLEPSQTADIAFTADNPGCWMFHCHILDHMINPGPQGEGNETTPANMGGLMTFIRVLPAGQVKDRYEAAGSLYSSPSCNRDL